MAEDERKTDGLVENAQRAQHPSKPGQSKAASTDPIDKLNNVPDGEWPEPHG